MIIDDTDTSDELDPVHGLQLGHQLLVSLQLLFIECIELSEFDLVELLLDPLVELEKGHLVDLSALLVHLLAIKLEHLLKSLIVHLVREPQHLEELQVDVLAETIASGVG